jgi:hypothetical protein
MGKKKTKSSSRKSSASACEAVSVPTTSISADKQDLRTVPPVARMRGLQEGIKEKLEKDLTKLKAWQTVTDNQAAKDAVATLGGVLNELEVLDSQLAELEESGFSPARKSFTAKAAEGDRVTVLDDKREGYSEIMDPESMVDLLVVKKRPGKSGGLVVESKDHVRMQVPVSHVVLRAKAA